MAGFNTSEARDALGRWTKSAGAASRAAGAAAARGARAVGRAAAPYVARGRKAVTHANTSLNEKLAHEADLLPGRIAKATARGVSWVRADVMSRSGRNDYLRYRASEERQGMFPTFGRMQGKNAHYERIETETRKQKVKDIKRAAKLGMAAVQEEHRKAARDEVWRRKQQSNMRNGGWQQQPRR